MCSNCAALPRSHRPDYAILLAGMVLFGFYSGQFYSRQVHMVHCIHTEPRDLNAAEDFPGFLSDVFLEVVVDVSHHNAGDKWSDVVQYSCPCNLVLLLSLQ